MRFFDFIRKLERERLAFILFIVLFLGLVHLAWRTGEMLSHDVKMLANHRTIIGNQDRLLLAIGSALSEADAREFLAQHKKTQSQIAALSAKIDALKK